MDAPESLGAINKFQTLYARKQKLRNEKHEWTQKYKPCTN